MTIIDAVRELQTVIEARGWQHKKTDASMPECYETRIEAKLGSTSADISPRVHYQVGVILTVQTGDYDYSVDQEAYVRRAGLLTQDIENRRWETALFAEVQRVLFPTGILEEETPRVRMSLRMEVNEIWHD